MRKIVFSIIGIAVFCLFVGCGFNINSHISPLLDPNYLNVKTGTAKINLAENGQCLSVTLPVDPVNIETRTEKHMVYDLGGGNQYLEPKEFIDKAVEYLQKKLIESNLKVDKQSGRKILVSFEDATSTGWWSFGTTVKLKIDLPEINYSQIYSGYEGSGLQHHATAYALHLAIIEFINDPIFQKYVQCR